MAVTVTKKFNYIEDGATRIYRPGDVIILTETADWAIASGYAIDAGEEVTPKTLGTHSRPTSKARRLGAPENADAAQEPNKGRFPKRAKGDDGTMVLGSEDEFKQ